MDTKKIEKMFESNNKLIPPPKKWVPTIKSKLKEYRRVLKITKKPDKEEFSNTVKVAGIGTLIIGAIGFTIFIIVYLITQL